LRRGENFQHAQLTTLGPHAVGECSSGVNGDAKNLSAAGHEEGRVHQKCIGRIGKGTSSTRVTRFPKKRLPSGWGGPSMTDMAIFRQVTGTIWSERFASNASVSAQKNL